MTATGDDTSIVTAMRHALSLAGHGPVFGVNPQVGCVILDSDGRMLAEGWHRGAGTAHAEVDALSKLAPGQARGATAVVTLEPCNHTGLTGPCSQALIDAGVARVFFGATDPGPLSGGGAEHLRQAGVEVTGGALLSEVEDFLRPWLTATRLRRPYVTLKWASSLDGRAAASDGSSQWITGTAARQRVHEQRAASDAIIVGSGTVLADDPSLTARGDAGELLEHQPIPVVIGMTPVPSGSKLFTHPQPLIQAHNRDLDEVLRGLCERGIRHAFVEGGPTLASAFIAAGLVDEYLIYLAPALIGGDRLAIGDIGVGTIGEARRLSIHGIERVGDDVLIIARPISTEGAS
ncbi:MAG TPA: bifunctional diaminohydroxyphosphoribosylaminopyrimidine deaminase/5-amino-6-(5-phosphoribosylamino)uracil reductase RibD [Homoserinimonas sp.]|nr:bifunctional diaminohydroxyphosphoribosylaminopyrimidine deaminase/5-amino-6-(5-phosphoribosylamino)uracil reductase RibD [Homoserinimonas sp.]